jgi:hypothetical protein
MASPSAICDRVVMEGDALNRAPPQEPYSAPASFRLHAFIFPRWSGSVS